MRKLIFAIAGLFSLIATSAHSFTLEGIAKSCHPWSKTNFSYDISGLDLEEQLAVGVCIDYMAAFRDARNMNCGFQKQLPDLKVAAFHFHSNYSIQQLAQIALNYKRDNPDEWGYNSAQIAFKMLPNAKCD